MHYVSINTQVLGFLLQEVTNRSISEYLYEKIWNPLGMEDSAYFILDDVEDELALARASLAEHRKRRDTTTRTAPATQLRSATS